MKLALKFYSAEWITGYLGLDGTGWTQIADMGLTAIAGNQMAYNPIRRTGRRRRRPAPFRPSEVTRVRGRGDSTRTRRIPFDDDRGR